MTSRSANPAQLPAALRQRLLERLARLYPRHDGESLLGDIQQLIAQQPDRSPRPGLWDQADAVLITYADQIRDGDGPGLPALRQFLTEQGIDRRISTVHLLPFCPYSSDDGFSVIDYRQVDPDAGDWEDVRALGERVELMFDLVLNHVSRQSDWFKSYVAGEPPYVDFFIEADPREDLRQVVRPRSLPLLTSVETSRGPRHVWTTFSEDQIDLDFANWRVLLEMLGVLLFYVAQGARIVRLDAVAFLWKRLGTSCIHLPETHEVVRLMRDVLEAAAPDVILLTETNVPHAENISYFGDGDEAQMVYQFSLPPLLLEAMSSGDATALDGWLERLEPPPPGCTFFNFTASHDGIGVRPLEGLIDDDRLERLVEHVKRVGGRVGTRRMPDGRDAPYELNVTYVDAVRPAGPCTTAEHAARFLATQAVMLGLQGMPGIYFHSLVGTENDVQAAESSGIPRRINRRKFQQAELRTRLADPEGLPRLVLDGYLRLLALRRLQPALHPEASQRRLPPPALPDDQSHGLTLVERSGDGQRLLLALNVGSQAVRLPLPEGPWEGDLISGVEADGGCFEIAPGRAAWLTDRVTQRRADAGLTEQS